VIADLDGRVALVTGAGSGIGLATVECLLEQGATVEATDLRPDGLAGLGGLSGANSERLQVGSLDVTDRDGVHNAIEAAADRHGRLDILVCSAGIVFAGDTERQADERADWDRCMAVNLYGTINACKAATAHLRRSDDGAIVTIGSISAHASRVTAGAYPTSKAAALRYTKSLALTMAPAVRANAVCPGAVWTGMQQRISNELQRWTQAAQPDDETSFFARYEAMTPMKRPQTPADVAKAVVFLASPDAANITGQCLHVDGGTVIRD
jgi:NAD(P)-dependent dehydrogenase (short-subunit alcohol dehydrogenase family)